MQVTVCQTYYYIKYIWNDTATITFVWFLLLYVVEMQSLFFLTWWIMQGMYSFAKIFQTNLMVFWWYTKCLNRILHINWLLWVSYAQVVLAKNSTQWPAQKINNNHLKSASTQVLSDNILNITWYGIIKCLIGRMIARITGTKQKHWDGT